MQLSVQYQVEYLEGLQKITSVMDRNAWTKMDEQYPGHANALIKAGLDPNIFMILKEFCRKPEASKFINKENRGNRSARGCNT